MSKYIAKTSGYLHKHGYIEKGKTFDWDGPKGSWMEEVKPPEPVREEAVEEEPEPVREEAVEEVIKANGPKRKGRR